jgi:hypothetical protein
MDEWEDGSGDQSMKLNILGWKEEDTRPTMKDIQFKLMDFTTEKYKWLTLKDVEYIAKSDGSVHTKIFTTFMEKALVRVEEIKKSMDEGFEKKFIKKYVEDKYSTGEIVEFHYGNVISAPRLMKRLGPKDFYYKVPSWGVDDVILIDAKKFGVEDIYLIDEYNNIHFYTTMKRFNILGESMSWGKTYLPLKHFEIYKYGNRVPNYDKYLKGIEVYENIGTN